MNVLTKCFRFLLFVYFSLVYSLGYGQWSGAYGNEWIDYSGSYLRIGVTERGLNAISFNLLPASFTQSPENIQLWHRGKEVSILSHSDNRILFYAETNDGASDSLLFRPMNARVNPFISLFSEEGSYMLTVKKGAKRAQVVLSGEKDFGSVGSVSNIVKEVRTFKNQFSHSTLTPVPNPLNNSFYENINGWTGPTVYGTNVGSNITGPFYFEQTFNVKNLDGGKGNPTLEVMLTGMHNGDHQIHLSIGKSNAAQDQREIDYIRFTGLGVRKSKVMSLNDSDFDASGKCVLTMRSDSKTLYDWYSLTYCIFSYPQKMDLSGEKTKLFTLPASTETSSKIAIANVPGDNFVLDISSADAPLILKGKATNAELKLEVTRIAKSPLQIFVSNPSEIKIVTADKVKPVSFKPVYEYTSAASDKTNPASYDYLIITNDTLKNAAINYARYRSSVEGGSFKSIVFDVKSIYNQFNYGEPSAIALKRFVEYMLKDGIRQNHNLLLMGYSVTAPDSAQRRLQKELPNEVPTIGDPGSDVLLVSGLKGMNENMPAIPVGRISAFNEWQVYAYLNKVKSFEAETKKSIQGWQKNVLHLNGGHSVSEINQLRDILANLAPMVESGDVGGKVTPYVKQTLIEVEKVNISQDVNNGVGMITYFGHGSTGYTDLDLGIPSDVSRNYDNTGKYPLMYFNGCGVGNLFSSRNPNNIVMSLDWLITPNKGAMAVISNSFSSYVSPTSNQLKILYQKLFTDPLYQNNTIGETLRDVAKQIAGSTSEAYEVANLHQSNLQGDPALKLIRQNSVDYAVDPEMAITLNSESPDMTIEKSKNLTVNVTVSNLGKYIKGVKSLPLKISYYYNDKTDVVRENVDAVAYQEIFKFNIVNKSALQKIGVTIDPDNTVSEFRKTNNNSELVIDWSDAKTKPVYSGSIISDIVSPILSVTFNALTISNNDILPANPLIKLSVVDNRVLRADPTLLEVYLGKCTDGNCDLKRIDLGQSSGIQIRPVTDYAFELIYSSTELTDGSYKLLAFVKDNAGNTQAKPYSVEFMIGQPTESLSLITYPNPANDFVQFEVVSPGGEMAEKIIIQIFNSRGQIVDNIDVSSVTLQKKSLYWYPKVSSGSYIYKAVLSFKGGSEIKRTGRVVIVN